MTREEIEEIIQRLLDNPVNGALKEFQTRVFGVSQNECIDRSKIFAKEFFQDEEFYLNHLTSHWTGLEDDESRTYEVRCLFTNEPPLVQRRVIK
jgi:hypothetical protein